MDGSNPEHYPISDFLKWHDDKQLVLNPNFQRGPVWQAPARTYLIDSILRGYPIPKLLIRTVVDRTTRRTIRDVVDGQQRLRTIIDFAENKFVLGPKASEFHGLRYRDLAEDLQDYYLSYKLTTEQLINASDQDVLEVFVRINSYAVPVNDSELRNARYDNDFSTTVKTMVLKLRPLWELGIISERDRVRMRDQSTVAELYGFLIFGLTEGDERTITRTYDAMDQADAPDLPDPALFEQLVLETVNLLEYFRGERIVTRPHFSMVFAAVCLLRGAMPATDRVEFDPKLVTQAQLEIEATRENLSALNYLISHAAEDEVDDDDLSFVEASQSSTQRFRSRVARLPYYNRALRVQ